MSSVGWQWHLFSRVAVVTESLTRFIATILALTHAMDAMLNELEKFPKCSIETKWIFVIPCTSAPAWRSLAPEGWPSMKWPLSWVTIDGTPDQRDNHSSRGEKRFGGGQKNLSPYGETNQRRRLASLQNQAGCIERLEKTRRHTRRCSPGIRLDLSRSTRSDRAVAASNLLRIQQRLDGFPFTFFGSVSCTVPVFTVSPIYSFSAWCHE